MNAARFLESCAGKLPVYSEEVYSESTPYAEESAPEVEVSKPVMKALETFAKEAGKLSEPNMHAMSEALKLMGWSIDITERPVGVNEKGSYILGAIFPTYIRMLEEHRASRRGNFGYSALFGTKTEGSTLSVTGNKYSLNILRDHLLKTDAVKFDDISEIDSHEAKLYNGTPTTINTLKIVNPSGVMYDYVLISPKGEAFSVETVNADRDTDKNAKLWKFLYKSGAKESAQRVIDAGVKLLEERNLSNAGKCPVCLRYVERRKDGAIMTHGYRVFEFYRTKPCFGYEYQPWERSYQGAVDYLKHIVTVEIPYWKNVLARLRSAPPEKYRNSRYDEIMASKRYHSERTIAETKEWFVRGVDSQWETIYKRNIAEVEMNIRMLESEIPMLEKRIAAWKPTKFWHEEHR